MFGVQWDLVLKYLETKGTSQMDLKTDSTSWGNYTNNAWNITNVDSKYYKKPTAGYRGYFFGGTVKSPLYESFYLEYEGNMLAPQ